MTLNCALYYCVCVCVKNLRGEVIRLSVYSYVLLNFESIKFIVITDTNRGVTRVEIVVLPARAAEVEGRKNE